MYHSIIIEESLKKLEVLRNFKILRTKFSAEENWHLHIVEIPEPEKAIKEIQEVMVTDRPYYFHIYNEGNALVVIFKDKIFRLNPNDRSTWKEACVYGAARLNIPSEQLDFYPTRISEEDVWYEKLGQETF